MNKQLKQLAERLIRKVQNRINKYGAYENAGEKEMEILRKAISDHQYGQDKEEHLTYQEECELRDYFRSLQHNLKYNHGR